MGIEVHPAVAGDMKRCAQIELLAFSESPINHIMFPGPFPPESEGSREEELINFLNEDPAVRVFKAVDTELTGDDAVLAWAKWCVYPDGMPDRPKRIPPPGSNPEAYDVLFGCMDRMTRRLMVGKPCVYLKVLVTDPKHQRRGIGAELLKWGLQEAVRLRIPAYLEGSDAAHKLYGKAGFRDIEKMEMDFSKWGEKELHFSWAMLWEVPSQ